MKRKYYFIGAAAALSLAALAGGFAAASTETEKEAFMETEMESESETDEDPFYYEMVTDMPKEEVEEFAAKVKEAYLGEDWEAISEWINYPINMYPDVKVENADDFLAYMEDKVIAEADRKEMEDDSCRNMFVNGEGICFGTGQIWMADFSGLEEDEAKREPKLEIIAVSGFDTK